MLTKSLSLGVIATSLITGFTLNSQPVSAQSVQFECATDDQNIPTTYAQTPGGIVQIFKWTSTFFNPPYTPIQRCQEVAQRLNQFQPDHLVEGNINNYNVICAGTSCDPGGTNLLLTLRPDQSPAQVLAEIDSTRDGAGGPSMQLGNGSSRNRAKSNLFRTSNGSTALNLRGYIQSAPKIPKKLSGGGSNTANSQPQNNNPTSNTNPSSVLNQEPITVPKSSGSSSRGSAW